MMFLNMLMKFIKKNKNTIRNHNAWGSFIRKPLFF